MSPRNPAYRAALSAVRHLYEPVSSEDPSFAPFLDVSLQEQVDGLTALCTLLLGRYERLSNVVDHEAVTPLEHLDHLIGMFEAEG